jgi:hypothetical protein
VPLSLALARPHFVLARQAQKTPVSRIRYWIFYGTQEIASRFFSNASLSRFLSDN